MSQEQAADQAAGNAAAAAAQGRGKFFKLPDFWPSSPAAWFGVVERQFLLRGVESGEDKFSLVVSSLPEASARRVTHLLSDPPADPYAALKAALLSTHQLTDIQKAERLFNMDNLGSRRPMDLLAEMMELVKPGEEKTQLFAMLFLRRLPPHIRVQLTEDDHSDLRSLAEKADRCAASWAAKHSAEAAVAAAVSSDDPDASGEVDELTVAATAGRGKFKGRGGKGGGGGRNKRGSGRSGSRSSKDSDSPLDIARAAVGLCRPHYIYGSKAYNCGQPGNCSWQEN